MGYNPYMYGNYMNMEAGDIAGMLVLLLGGIYLLTIGFSILAYVLQSLGTYTIAQRRGIKNPWLAWIPFGNVWIMGSISDQYQYVSRGLVRNRRKILLGLTIVICLLAVASSVFGTYSLIQMAANGIEFLELGMGFIAVWGLSYMVMLVLCVIQTVFQYICLYNLFASCDPNSKTGFLLLSIFLGVTMPFLVFACRKKDFGMPPRRPDPTPIDPPAFQG